MRRTRIRASFAIACIGLLLPIASGAVTCSVSTAGLAFGNYDLLSSAPLTSTVTARLTCSLDPAEGTQHVAAMLMLSTGSSAAHAQREMANGAERLRYNVYTTNGYVTVWGDGSGGSGVRAAAFTLNKGNPTRFTDITGYGRVPAQQDVAAGSYADNLVVSVNF